VRRGQGVLVEALARRGPAAGLVAVIGGHAGEAVARARRRRHRRIGVAPIGARVGIVLGGVAVMVRGPVVMPGFGGSFGGSSTDEESCSDESDRRTRPGHSAQRLQRQHLVVPTLVLPHMWLMEPPSVCERVGVSIPNAA
jgi:hypothetical protein